MSSNPNLQTSSTINNNEIYEKLRPLKRITTIFQEHQAHGDDTRIQISKDPEKSLELFSYESQQIPPMSSSSNEFSFEMAIRMTETSNEALKTDDENGMTKSKYHQKEREIILSDVSLQQQLSNDECEYEIDLGNGYITPYYKQQQRVASIISADSIQPITNFQIPFNNTVYKSSINPKQEIPVEEQQTAKFSLRTVEIFSIGTTMIIFLIVVMFFVF